ncbi:MAG: universal stress protein [Planctomycetes bacterium]|nr:universal stress protein [Planctomycetota bacterium]
MMRLQTILVGMDWSPASMDAWREACALARTFGARLVLAHAVPETTSVRAEREEVVLQAEAMLRQLAVDVGAEAARVVVEEGRPADVLLAVAGREQVDLVVLGAGARTTLDRVLLGSCAERVVRESPAPVWLVRPGRAHPEVRRILCALDGDLEAKESDEALRAAVYLCRTFVADLTLVTVVPDPGAARPWAGEASGLPEAVARGEEALRRRLEGIDRHGVETRVLVRAGKPAPGIVEAAGLVGCDLLVMGTRGLTGLAHLWSGSTAERVIRAVPSSVLVVKAR